MLFLLKSELLCRVLEDGSYVRIPLQNCLKKRLFKDSLIPFVHPFYLTLSFGQRVLFCGGGGV